MRLNAEQIRFFSASVGQPGSPSLQVGLLLHGQVSSGDKQNQSHKTPLI